MLTIARTGQRQSQEPETQFGCSTWVVGTQLLKTSSGGITRKLETMWSQYWTQALWYWDTRVPNSILATVSNAHPKTLFYLKWVKRESFSTTAISLKEWLILLVWITSCITAFKLMNWQNKANLNSHISKHLLKNIWGQRCGSIG